MSAQQAPPFGDGDNVIPIRPEKGAPASRPSEARPSRQPVVPPWLRSRQSHRRAAVERRPRRPPPRVPHGPAAALRALAGTPLPARPPGRALLGTWAWVFGRDDAGTHQLRVDAAARRDHKACATAARIRKDRVRTQMLGLLCGMVLAAVSPLGLTLPWTAISAAGGPSPCAESGWSLHISG